jgi:hypothetical protein
MQATWLYEPKTNAWKSLDANKKSADFAKQTAAPKQVGYPSSQSNLAMTPARRCTTIRTAATAFSSAHVVNTTANAPLQSQGVRRLCRCGEVRVY